MSLINVGLTELSEVVQHLNIIKVKFGSIASWMVAPLLFTADESIDIIIDSSNINMLSVGVEAVLKFQKNGYEYIVSGQVENISSGNLAVATIKLNMGQKYFNLRKHMRFDTELNASIQCTSGACAEGTVKNISRGGIMWVTTEDVEMSPEVTVKITFQSGLVFQSEGKIVRKTKVTDGLLNCGIQFTRISEDGSKIFNDEIQKYEREYFNSLNVLREYTNRENLVYDTKVLILSYDADQSYEIREVLVKIGADNFDMLQNFTFYSQLITEENPKIVIVNVDEYSEEIFANIKEISEIFPQINIILLMNLAGADENEEKEACIPEGITVLYKPLIGNEFEEVILKYL